MGGLGDEGVWEVMRGGGECEKWGRGWGSVKEVGSGGGGVREWEFKGVGNGE